LRRLALAVAVALAPQAARAGNGLLPRVPVVWPADTPCMTVVDRSQSPVVHFDYSITMEDTGLLPDEVPDSRRHQFVAFCRDHTPQEDLPPWLSWQDVEAAAMTTPPQLDVMDVAPADVMEASAYKDCFWRIDADDQRRPITHAAAMKGVDWDTTGLPAGPYVVAGYTWMPVYNIWSARPGVIHVVDGPDLSAAAPAAAVTTLDDYMFVAEPLVLHGCVRALPGSTMTGYWADTNASPLEWRTFAVDVPIAGEELALPFEAPIEAVNGAVTLRIDVTDPMQRTFSAYAPRVIGVLPGDGETDGCAGTGSFITAGCGGSDGDSGGVTGGAAGSTGGSTSAGTSGGSSGEAGTGGPNIDEASGCGCDSAAGGAWGLLALGLLVRRRKRGSTLGPS
jgi:MYXO-CTERM domain-containing protein